MYVQNQQDVFIETIVKRRKTSKDKLAILGFVVLFIVLIMVAFYFIEYLFAFLVLILIGGAYGLYFAITTFDKEFEYICTNGHLDIDQITHKRKRKRLMSIPAKEMEVLAPLDSEDYKQYSRNQNLKTLNLTTNTGPENVWFFVGHYKGTNYLVTFEPNDRILKDLKRHNPSKVKYNLATGRA